MIAPPTAAITTTATPTSIGVFDFAGALTGAARSPFAASAGVATRVFGTAAAATSSRCSPPRRRADHLRRRGRYRRRGIDSTAFAMSRPKSDAFW